MKHVYIDAHLQALVLAVKANRTPNAWVFTQGREWLLLTPKRLHRLALMLGLGDKRIDNLVMQVRRHCPNPSRYCAPLGIKTEDPPTDGRHPIALCPVCDSIHRPHPLDAGLACAKCQAREQERQWNGPTPGRREDLAADESARQRIREKTPDAFDGEALSPNWRYNRTRRLQRDWDRAVNRILMGETYRKVAAEFDCSTGTLHRKVRERAHWEDN